MLSAIMGHFKGYFRGSLVLAYKPSIGLFFESKSPCLLTKINRIPDYNILFLNFRFDSRSGDSLHQCTE